MYVPFTAVTGMMLNKNFTNVEVTNGKVVSDGNNQVVVGFAFPGLSESLDLDSKDLEDIEIPDYVEVTADVEDFSLDMTMTFVMSDILQELDVEIDKLRKYVRLSYRLKYIDFKKYKQWSEKVNEIGRMLGGWMASTKK